MSWRDCTVGPTSTLVDVSKRLVHAGYMIALVVDDSDNLLGIVADSDICKALARGVSLDEEVSEVMNTHPVIGYDDQSFKEHHGIMRAQSIYQLPILNRDNRIVGLRMLDDTIHPMKRTTTAVIMAGGLGNRLRPLTEDCPKPLLRVGKRRILETILLQLKRQGFQRVLISVNYLANLIQTEIGDGTKFGLHIEYLHESKRLGTAGALSNIPEEYRKDSLLVMNGDILSHMSYSNLVDYHNEQNADVTIVAREHFQAVPFGVVSFNGDRVIGIQEKPHQHCFINAGVYVLKANLLNAIPGDTFYDMPTLVNRAIGEQKAVSLFRSTDYWIDIGTPEDYERAQTEWTDRYKEADTTEVK